VRNHWGRTENFFPPAPGGGVRRNKSGTSAENKPPQTPKIRVVLWVVAPRESRETTPEVRTRRETSDQALRPGNRKRSLRHRLAGRTPTSVQPGGIRDERGPGSPGG
jgi:hypothetical protein